MRHDVPNKEKKTVSEVFPHLVFHNFSSQLGERVREGLEIADVNLNIHLPAYISDPLNILHHPATVVEIKMFRKNNTQLPLQNRNKLGQSSQTTYDILVLSILKESTLVMIRWMC